jgi:hypothetical protein
MVRLLTIRCLLEHEITFNSYAIRLLDLYVIEKSHSLYAQTT